MFGASPINIPVNPVPVIVAPPGEAVTVHEPLAGKPLSATSPVATAQVGCVIAPITGAVGVEGAGAITTLAQATETQPAAFVTVKV